MLTDADATVIAAVVAAIAAIAVACLSVLVAWLNRRQLQGVHADNRSDHGQVRAAIEGLTVEVSEVKSDVRAIRADVRDLRAEDRDQAHRLEALENPTRKKVAS